MHPETRNSLFDLTADRARAWLDLSARGLVALVEEGLLDATLPFPRRRPVALADARWRSDQVSRLAEDAPGELARIRQAYPRRTPDFDRAIALGALLRVLGA